jgi:hypothetical protein
MTPEDTITGVASTDDGSALAVGTREGKVLVRAGAHGPAEVAWLHSTIGCLQWARSGRALVVAVGTKAFVIGVEQGVAFSFWTAPARIARCGRSPDEDRFSFVGDDGTAWVKAFDLGGVAESYVPPDPSAPDAVPTVAGWKGLPVGLVR